MSIQKLLARWDDLEAFGVIAEGLQKQKTLQQIALEPHSPLGGARILYLRLGRLERTLGRRLVDRRPWGRSAHLTAAGETVAQYVTELTRVRQRVHESFTEAEVPVLRIAAHATLVSTLLPTVIQQHQGRGQDFNVELVLVHSYAEALRAVDDGRVDAGVHLVFPQFDDLPLPRNVRSERLGTTETVVIFPTTHRWAAPAKSGTRRSVHLDDLLDESVITRGYVDNRLLPTGGGGRRIRVPHVLDKLSYVRLGIGVSLYPRLAFDLLGPVAGVRALPLQPAVPAALVLLQPRKRTRPLEQPAAAFLKELRPLWERLAKGK